MVYVKQCQNRRESKKDVDNHATQKDLKLHVSIECSLASTYFKTKNLFTTNPNLQSNLNDQFWKRWKIKIKPKQHFLFTAKMVWTMCLSRVDSKSLQ